MWVSSSVIEKRHTALVDQAQKRMAYTVGHSFHVKLFPTHNAISMYNYREKGWGCTGLLYIQIFPTHFIVYNLDG